jgi:2-polyprenyl-6-methoxyphenol hydroxylase-like FAD-dependent oxidoreductase
MLIGDAAGAVSPLTAGGLDPCMRLSAFAAKVVAEYLSTGDPQVLDAYSGNIFRSRFASRVWARRMASTIHQRNLLELGCAILRVPLVNRLARHVFFGRGSFPDVEMPDAFCGSPHCAVAVAGPQFSSKTKSA